MLASSALEIWGFVTGLACVWLVARSSVWNFPVAIVACALAAVVYVRARLYSDAGLQGVFIVLGAYGWWVWVRRRPGEAVPELPVTRTGLRLWLLIGAFVVAFTAVFGYLFERYTDAAAPYVDNFATAVSIAAQYQIARKKLENWLLWIGVDVLYVGLYWHRGIVLFSIQYVIFLGLAVYGYWQWRRLARQAEATAGAPVVPPVATALEDSAR
ncbi:nicotinamide riboside transporter PnuC [Hymenobacter coalescens]